MNLKNIVCDLEYAAKLKELGVRREPIFSYLEYDCEINGQFIPNTKMIVEGFDENLSGYTRAYTIAELGEMLPKKIDNAYLEIHFDTTTCDAVYHDYKLDSNKIWRTDPKEANARAKLLIWLIEYNYVKVENLNKQQ